MAALVIALGSKQKKVKKVKLKSVKRIAWWQCELDIGRVAVSTRKIQDTLQGLVVNVQQWQEPHGKLLHAAAKKAVGLGEPAGWVNAHQVLDATPMGWVEDTAKELSSIVAQLADLEWGLRVASNYAKTKAQDVERGKTNETSRKKSESTENEEGAIDETNES